MRHSSTRLASVLLITSALAGPAWAGDWYVDAINGNDSASGTSPASAWKTITHAVIAVPPGGVETIHIAEGVYSESTGEVFPIRPAPGQQLIGAQGAQRPILQSTSEASALLSFRSLVAQPRIFDAQSRVERLNLRRANVGIEMLSQAGEVSPTIVDVRLARFTVNSITIEAAGGASAPVFERVETRDSFEFEFSPLLVTGSGVAVVTARDCFFGESLGPAVRLWAAAHLDFARCTLEAADAGFELLGGSQTQVRLTDSTIAYCDRAFSGGGGEYVFTRCTIANNGWPSEAGSATLRYDHCIVSESGPVVLTSPSATVEATRSFISDGSFDGVNGCFSGDPGFRDGPSGDFRLRWDSPCVDAAFVNAPVGARDLVGSSRGIDGNLDTLGATDLGALEFQPLELVTSGSIASPLRLEHWGPQGAPTVVYWARAGLVGAQSTPFGASELDQQLARTFRVTTAGAGMPNVTQRWIPNQLALVGHTFSFQALTDSSAAPLGKALTNGVEFTVVP